MKKMKKLNLNKISIVSLRSIQTLKGGVTAIGCLNTNTCQDPSTSLDPDNCHSTGRTNPFGGGTFASDPIATNTCSAVITECELGDM